MQSVPSGSDVGLNAMGDQPGETSPETFTLSPGPEVFPDFFMRFIMSAHNTSREKRTEVVCDRGAEGSRVCPVCQGRTLIEIRGKLQCERCHTICETCCEGGRG